MVEEFYDDLERKCTDTIELSPNGPKVAINVPIDQWHSILENKARSCSMDPAYVTPEYVCRMLGGTMALEDIAESLEKAKALLR